MTVTKTKKSKYKSKDGKESNFILQKTTALKQVEWYCIKDTSLTKPDKGSFPGG